MDPQCIQRGQRWVADIFKGAESSLFSRRLPYPFELTTWGTYVCFFCCLLFRADASAFEPMSLRNVQLYINIFAMVVFLYAMHILFTAVDQDVTIVMTSMPSPGVNLNPISWQRRGNAGKKDEEKMKKWNQFLLCVVWKASNDFQLLLHWQFTKSKWYIFLSTQ